MSIRWRTWFDWPGWLTWVTWTCRISCQVERRVEGLVGKEKQAQTVLQQVEAMAWFVVKGH